MPFQTFRIDLEKYKLYTESGLKLLRLDLASLATQGVCAEAQPNAYTGNGIQALLRMLG